MAVSLKRRLTTILLGLTLLTWLLSALGMAFHVRQIMVGQVDRHIRLYSDMSHHSLSAVFDDPYVRRYYESRAEMGPKASGATFRRVKGFWDSVDGSAVNLWFGRTQILAGVKAPAFPAPEREGFITHQLADGSQWRILYRRHPAFNVWHAVGVDLKTARQGGLQTFMRGILPLSVILPISLLILFLGIRSGLRPLNELARQIATRKPYALEPVPLSDVPKEIRPVVVSLNALLRDLRRALASEHRFTSNAAHELQNPLAAILAGIQSCQWQLRSVPGSEETAALLQRIASRVTGAAETVRQLLTLARLGPDQEFQRRQVDMGQLVADVMADVGGLAMDRGIEVRFNPASPVSVSGNPDWLKILVSNLLVNAFKYARSQGEVEVIVECHADHSSLVILNDCDPLPDNEFHLLTEAFYHPVQGADQEQSQGVGLGLSIVQRIAELHGAELHLGSWKNGRGFRAEVRFRDNQEVRREVA